MKFSSEEEIDAPAEAVFAMITDFEAFERAAEQRGADVRRRAASEDARLGTEWDTAFDILGKRREILLRLVQCDPDSALAITASSSGLEGMLRVDLLALSPTRTRMTVELELRALNLTGRLVLQSLKLGKQSLADRLEAWIAQHARQLERNHRDKS